MIRTKDFYNRLAPIYDPLLSAVFAFVGFDEDEYRAKTIRKLAGTPPDVAVIDIGCGTGRNFRYIQDLLGNRRIYGVDISDRMLSIAKTRAINERIHSIQLVESDLHNWQKIKSLVGNDYIVVSSFTLSVIWGDKRAIEGYLSLCSDAIGYSIMDGYWGIGESAKGRLVRVLSVPFAIDTSYWLQNTGKQIAQYIGINPNISFGGMLCNIYRPQEKVFGV